MASWAGANALERAAVFGSSKFFYPTILILIRSNQLVVAAGIAAVARAIGKGATLAAMAGRPREQR
ncbi:hypothetical protein [Mycolicibacterium austroafricanum]|uniref:hypothetical protein n=1 Tax=Mycolicibacterium austroafricanum TaxID=39687 RepID=UPI001CA380B7|nr:hypothetical protein [Mycolicibacterium austroafricanum]QZT58609.1 hypothetical protein JN084_08525 [Mycolicibacterium austroafricanum]